MSRISCTRYGETRFAIMGKSMLTYLPLWLSRCWHMNILSVRYWKGHVYSYTGPILIAVNPWKPVSTWIIMSCYSTLTKFVQVDIYNINVLERHKSSASKEPHIFGVASKAFRLGKISRLFVSWPFLVSWTQWSLSPAQGAVEFSEKPMHSYIWRIRLRKDRKYEICPAGGIKK
jgi:hypothetical protein